MLSQTEYLQLMFGLSGIYYIVSGLTFWGKFYVVNVLLISEERASYYVSFSTLTSVILGILIGGLINSALGGFTTVKARRFTMAIAWAIVPICLPIPIVSDFFTWGVCVWLLLFLGAMILPSLFGLMLAALPPNKKAQGNSFG